MAAKTISMRASDNSIVKLECHTRLESCAQLAKEYAIEGCSDRFAVISEYDYSHNSDERGLYMSLVLRPSFFPSQAGLLSALATVALAKALEEHTTKRLGIGWISNIFCEGRQIGNVSIEGKLDSFMTYEYIIVNFAVRLSPSSFPPRISDLIKKVFESDNYSVSTIIAKNVINKFFALYSNMKNSTKYMNIYRQKFILSGIKIKYIKDGKKRACKVLSVNTEDCSLIVEMKDKSIKHVTSAAHVVIPRNIKLPKK